MIWMMLACQPRAEDTSGLFDTWTYPEETSQRQILAEGFLLPKDLTRDNDDLLFVDQEEGTVVRVQTNGTYEILEDNLGSPSLVATNNSTIVVYDTEYQQLLKVEAGAHSAFTSDDEEVVVDDLLVVNNTVYWIDTQGGSLYKQGLQENTPSLVLEYLASPYSLIVADNVLWIACQGDNSIWSYAITLDYAEQVAILEDVPHRMHWTDSRLWVTTRSKRWPYGGWIVSLTGGQMTKHVESPPEPEYVVASQDTIYWTSKQSITTYVVDAASYQMFADQTAASSPIIQHNDLYWLDPQRGMIYTQPLAE